jgi:hypothetical protein
MPQFLMSRARACFLGLLVTLSSSYLLAKDEPSIVLLWPSHDNATLKLTFGRFRSLGGFEGKLTLVSDVIVENLSPKVIPHASFSVFLLDKDRVRIGNGLLVVNDLDPGESAKVQFQCESVGAPVTLSIAAKNNAGVPTSLKTIPLQVISVPPGASLKVDGKDEGFTPATINLAVGNHNLELRKDGYGLTAMTQNPKTDTAGIRGKLGQKSGTGDKDDAQEGSHGRADCGGIAAGGSGSASGRHLSQGGDQPGHVLSLETEVYRGRSERVA